MIVIFQEYDGDLDKPGDKIGVNTNHVKAVFQVTSKGKDKPYCLVSLGDLGSRRVMGTFDEVISKIQNA